jgi:hypothetical protein
MNNNFTMSDFRYFYEKLEEQIDTDLADKADLSIFTPMTQAEYDALVTKTAPLYFIYEDGEST